MRTLDVPHSVCAMAPTPSVISRAGVEALIQALRRRGFRPIGPVVRNGAIVHAEIGSVDDLPAGWHDEQGPGSYRLSQADDDELFGWAVGQESFKGSIFPSTSVVWRGRKDVANSQPETVVDRERPEAFFGARPCEVAALSILGSVLTGGAHPDPDCSRRQAAAFVAVVECGSPAATCFCASMGTGPSAASGFDLALTELREGVPRFLVRVGSDLGQQLLEEIGHVAASSADFEAREQVTERSRQQMRRTLDATTAPSLLARNLSHPRWDDVAERCLACGNCTLVCPTCFCSAIEEHTDLEGTVELTRRWDSCFDVAHSFLHGGPVRSTTRSRYRQWMTHKLSTWVDQFGMSGCVGCGRCITWCPVGIDITEEVAAIAATDGAQGVPAHSGTAGEEA